MKTASLIVALLWALAVIPASGQTPSAGNTPASTAATTAAAPVAKTPPGTSVDKPPEAPKKPKKVWTNDEVGSLKGSVSVVGGKHAADSQSVAENDQNGKEAGDLNPRAEKVRQYRDTIDQAKTQIADADAQIAKLKDFKGENVAPSGGINPSQTYNMVPPEEQVKQLEARKKQLEAKIEDLENQARKEGIDPGELR
jgi:multidrug efflux pump subunit AcrB